MVCECIPMLKLWINSCKFKPTTRAYEVLPRSMKESCNYCEFECSDKVALQSHMCDMHAKIVILHTMGKQVNDLCGNCHNRTQQQLNLTRLRLDIIIKPNPPTPPTHPTQTIQASCSDSSDCLAPALHQPDVRLTSDCLRN